MMSFCRGEMRNLAYIPRAPAERSVGNDHHRVTPGEARNASLGKGVQDLLPETFERAELKLSKASFPAFLPVVNPPPLS